MNPDQIRRLMLASALAGGFLPFERTLFAPENDPANGGGGGGGSGGGEKPPPAKTYSDAELNALLAKERRSHEEKTNAAIAAAKAEADAKLAELQQQVELAGKTADEKAKIQAENAAKKIEREREELAKQRDAEKARADGLDGKLRSTVQQHQLSSALAVAKVFPTALDYAVQGLLREATELDVDPASYEIKALTVDGVRYTDLPKAAEAFLEKRPFFKSAPPGGAGSSSPNGGGQQTGSLHQRAADALRDAMAGNPAGLPMGQRGG